MMIVEQKVSPKPQNFPRVNVLCCISPIYFNHNFQ